MLYSHRTSIAIVVAVLVLVLVLYLRFSTSDDDDPHANTGIDSREGSPAVAPSAAAAAAAVAASRSGGAAQNQPAASSAPMMSDRELERSSKHDRKNNNGTHHQSNGQSKDPYGRIGILTLADYPRDPEIRSFPQALTFHFDILSWRTKQAYCRKWGYACLKEAEALDKSRHAAFSKILALRKWLGAKVEGQQGAASVREKFDWILWMDTDAMIMNFNVSLRALLRVISKRVFNDDMALARKDSQNPRKDIILLEDWNGFSTGVFLIRSSAWSLDFLARVDKGLTKEQCPHIVYWWEMAVFACLLDRGTERHKAQRKGGKNPRLKEDQSHVLIDSSKLPQRLFNAYLPPTNKPANPIDRTQRGVPVKSATFTIRPRVDFIAHAPNVKKHRGGLWAFRNAYEMNRVILNPSANMPSLDFVLNEVENDVRKNLTSSLASKTPRQREHLVQSIVARNSSVVGKGRMLGALSASLKLQKEWIDLYGERAIFF